MSLLEIIGGLVVIWFLFGAILSLIPRWYIDPACPIVVRVLVVVWSCATLPWLLLTTGGVPRNAGVYDTSDTCQCRKCRARRGETDDGA